MKTIFSLKRICLSVNGLLIAILFAVSPASFATPLYYTFAGEVTNTYGTNSSAIADAYGLSVGTSVNYTILLDFDAPGSITYTSGYTSTYNDNSSYDFFFADYIAGDALVLDYYTGIDKYNYGYDYRYDTYGRLVVDDILQLFAYNEVDDWIVGTAVTAYDYWNTSADGYGYIRNSMTLTSISSSYNEVPEPGTLLLFGLGLIGLAAAKRANKSHAIRA